MVSRWFWLLHSLNLDLWTTCLTSASSRLSGSGSNQDNLTKRQSDRCIPPLCWLEVLFSDSMLLLDFKDSIRPHMSCAKTCRGQGGDFRLLCTIFFLPLKKTKQNITLATIWLLAFFLCCSFNPDWFLKTREMFSEWKDKSLTPLCWEFIFQLCYTRIALGWIRYLMALVLKTQWTVCFWRNGQFSIDTCRARIARPNAVWSSESGAATPLRRGRREASSQESVKRIVTVLWRGGR